MKFIWFTKLLLIAQLVNFPDNLMITQQGQTIFTVNRNEFVIPTAGQPMIDSYKYLQFIEKLDRRVYQEPENAKIDVQENIVSEQIGYKLNQQEFTNQFLIYVFGNGPAKIEVPTLSIYPKVDSELLSYIREQQIGQYQTYFNSNNKNRAHNISLAVEALNNHILFPGEMFSFNHVVGKRTTKRGYLKARVIVKGEFSEGIGGGICQVSSTLFNAVDKAGMEIVQRYSHSRRVPYVPPGRDATVSWYGPDFQFKNKYNQPILIRAKAQGGTVVIKIYSSDAINDDPESHPALAINLQKMK
ncbi:hypothetical protein CVD25_00815 [Bacillus canaveralius]|uniref:Peptidoglycan binding domain-containing protein n=1 Tax=Bacillus canaveralius TaxID=1403243 RepID=A0A2N5GPH1_9BACI|nr:VanW family protein [Bacillus canaveralius]PLR84611.1 hypothetical protein CU635_05920 [Bacillus canaveralius]PLS00763.1 hypothetical protein CVD25_00815 [Bacillus canaveralius]